MKIILLAALTAGILGSAGIATIEGAGTNFDTAFVVSSTGVPRSAPAPTVFRVWMTGRETACTVSKVAARPDGVTAVRLSPECGQLPILSGVGQWRAKGDETVALADGNGRARIEFARADGVAYETFRPNAPLMAMIAVD